MSVLGQSLNLLSSILTILLTCPNNNTLLRYSNKPFLTVWGITGAVLWLGDHWAVLWLSCSWKYRHWGSLVAGGSSLGSHIAGRDMVITGAVLWLEVSSLGSVVAGGGIVTGQSCGWGRYRHWAVMWLGEVYDRR